MGDQEAEVPEYVRHFAVVYGYSGLRSFVADSQAMEVQASELEPVDSLTAVLCA